MDLARRISKVLLFFTVCYMFLLKTQLLTPKSDFFERFSWTLRDEFPLFLWFRSSEVCARALGSGSGLGLWAVGWEPEPDRVQAGSGSGSEL